MNELLELFSINIYFRLVVSLLLGMCIGSFLNVVVYRLPIMLDTMWRRQCQELVGDECKVNINSNGFNLMKPASHCPNCKANVPWWSNVPLFGYLFIRGRCVSCHSKVSLRYPIVEIVTGVLFVLSSYCYNDVLALTAVFVYVSCLFALMLIDLDTFLLPDEITLPLLWLGLLCNINGLFSGSLANAVCGAVIGYIFLWALYWLFKFITGKEGMGYGDFKLLAAIGAWIGWQNLVSVLLLSSILGIIYAVIMRVSGSLESGKPIPFGPFLGGAGIITLLFGVHLFPIF